MKETTDETRGKPVSYARCAGDAGTRTRSGERAEPRDRISRPREKRSDRLIASKRVAARDSARARRGILAKRRWRFFLGVQVFGARATRAGRAARPRDANARVTHLVCMAVDIMAAIVARVPVRRESGRANVRHGSRLRHFPCAFRGGGSAYGRVRPSSWSREKRPSDDPIHNRRVRTGENLRLFLDFVSVGAKLQKSGLAGRRKPAGVHFFHLKKSLRFSSDSSDRSPFHRPLPLPDSRSSTSSRSSFSGGCSAPRARCLRHCSTNSSHARVMPPLALAARSSSSAAAANAPEYGGPATLSLIHI